MRIQGQAHLRPNLNPALYPILVILPVDDAREVWEQEQEGNLGQDPVRPILE